MSPFKINSDVSLLCVQGTTDDDQIAEMGIYIHRNNGNEEIGIIIEGVRVLYSLRDIAWAFCFLLGLTYALDLHYPKCLQFTFEVFQKLFLDLYGHNLMPKVQRLKNYLCRE